MITEISFFRNRYAFLSNFYPSKIFYDYLDWKTVEHAYQAAKCLSPSDKQTIRDVSLPSEAKKLGQAFKMRPDWDNVRLSIMEDLLRLKFEPGSLMASLLLETGDAELIEGNYWNDRFWGQCPVGNGENHLGKILMKLRNELSNGTSKALGAASNLMSSGFDSRPLRQGNEK